MKLFTRIKTGYSSGAYGCTAEYYTIIWIDENGPHSIQTKGIYGYEYRVCEPLEAAGYKYFGVNDSVYGKIIGETKSYAYSEIAAIEKIKEILGQ
jgi:hypothetical protein